MTKAIGTIKTRRAALPGRKAALRLEVTEGPDQGASQVVPRPRVLVGRAETANLRLQDRTVSQFHVELAGTGMGIHVHDLSSRNGTRMGLGGALLERATIPSGSLLHLGDTTLRVSLDMELPELSSARTSFGGLFGQTAVMRDLFAMLERIARTDLTLLIEGETGTGKEVTARAVHAGSKRARAPFLVLDCTALPPTLAAAILFGHERGAFTGANERRVGLFEAASGGILFIDELGELAPELQPLLLRVLQQREVVPLGSTTPRPVDVRILSATWRDLRGMVNAGTFREDLYYRVAQATVHMPSLAERLEDIPLLVEQFLSRLPPDMPAARSVDKETLEALTRRSYPGNVRELQNTIERIAMLAEGPVITQAELAFERILAHSRGDGQGGAVPRPLADGPTLPFKEAKQSLIEDFERSYLSRLMERTRDNLTHAASVAGLERHNLRELLKKHGLYSTSGKGDAKD